MSTQVQTAATAEVSARLQPAHYTPPRVPAEVGVYAARPDTLEVGRPGKVGVLDLAFAETGGRTELTRHFQKSPLQIMRPLYYDPHRPDLPMLQLISTGGGVLQGDRLRIDIALAPSASAHVTTQAATKIHRMDFDYGVQQTFLDVGPDAYLECLPEPTIPFAGSRFYQRTVVTADPSATVVVGETVLAGRLARGERHAYDVFASDFELRRPDGELVAVDTVRMVPGGVGAGVGVGAGISVGVGVGVGVTGPAVLAGHDVLGTLYVISPLMPAARIADLLHAASAGSGLACGASVLPDECGAWIRVLGARTESVTRVLAACWDTVRRRLAGAPAPALRKS